MMLRTEFIRYLPSIVLELYDVRSVVRENLLESFLHFDVFYWLFYTIVLERVHILDFFFKIFHAFCRLLTIVCFGRGPGATPGNSVTILRAF